MRLPVHSVRFALPLAAAAVLGGLLLLPHVASRTRADEPKLAPRKPWTTSRVVGSPEPPPPFRTERVFPNVRLNHPLLLTRAAGTDRLFVGEQEGKLYSIANRPDATAELFLALTEDPRTLRLNPTARKLEFVYGCA